MQRCSGGTQNSPVTHTSHHRSHFADFIRLAAVVHASTERCPVGAERRAHPPAPSLWAALAVRMGFGFPPRCSPHVLGKPLPQHYVPGLLDLPELPHGLELPAPAAPHLHPSGLLKGTKPGEVEISCKERGLLLEQRQTPLSMPGNEEACRKDFACPVCP